MAVSSILRQISYKFNTNFLLINFAFVKKIQKVGTGPQAPPPPPLDPHWIKPL